ncbi:MAG: excinuclease ABC subunit UvrC [Nitrospirota bacterium]|nr:excinuclease ABC subunit UvrC [Nitrospirota bacterium]
MQEKLATIPRKPGVYLFKDDQGKILYVGKAKVLSNRVKSYFQKAAGLDERKSSMMKSVAGFELTITGNELEALILEANLIKQYKPRYNILLRDDKSYPYLKLTLHEKWPRLEVVRRIQKDDARYFGPYVPAGAMWETLSFIRNHYHIPSCRYSLEKRMRPCIQFQIRKCIGPCSGEVDHAEYMQMIREIELLLEGKNKKLLESLERKMTLLSEDMRFEEAAAVRDRIRAIQSVSESQKMVSPKLGDADIIGFFRQDDVVVFKLFFVRNGMMIGTRDFEQKHTAGEKDGYLFRNFIEQFYAREILPASELYCSSMPEDRTVLAEWLSGRKGSKVRIEMPMRGIKRKLVVMAEENSREIMRSRRAEADPDVLLEIASLLRLKKVPESIGAFDISNITGTSAVGAFVVWKAGAFDKSLYRNISMDEVKGPDDYAMMREMIRKTVKSLGERGEGQRAKGHETRAAGILRGELPDLIIIDGGREHLNAAVEALAPIFFPPYQGGIEGGEDCRPVVVGLAKDPDRIFVKDRNEPILIDNSRPASLLLRKIRDEVHRFAIRYHRKQRAKRMFDSPLESIYGLGRKRRFALLDHFGSIDAIKKASAEDIAGLKGFTNKLADDVLKALHTQEKVKGEHQ